MMPLKKLHLGCGNVKFPGWLNIDLDTPTADMNLDLTQPLPFSNGSITHIFNEHFIEHISRPEAVNFLVECRRVLSDNGVVRITTPNLRFLIASYLTSNKDEWGELWQPDTLCSLMNEGMRSWGHQFVYDADELVRILVEAGFNSISFQEYHRSQDKELCELESRPFHNELIVEARVTDNNIPSIDYQEVILIENLFPIKLNTEFFARINTAEQIITEQANHIRDVEAALMAREQIITEQANHIRDVEAALIKFQNSLYGKCLSVMSRLYSFMRNK